MAKAIKSNGLTVKTKDGVEVLGSDFNVEIKELDESTKSFWATASTENPDRDNDVIRVDGWDLKNYRLNPVGLFAHNYFEHPHFKTETIKVDKKSKSLVFKPVFDTHDRALITWNQFKNGFLTSFSVGFRPTESNFRDPENLWEGGREFTKQELLEISAVPVPAHPDARINMDGFILEPDNLIKDGFKQEPSFDESTGLWWYPITNLESYKDPKTVGNISKGITAIIATPTYKAQANVIPAVGYYFEKKEFADLDEIRKWFEKNNIKTNIKKYYSVDFSKDIEIELSEEELSDSEEEGCGGKKKPPKKATDTCPDCGEPLNEDGECTNPDCPSNKSIEEEETKEIELEIETPQVEIVKLDSQLEEIIKAVTAIFDKTFEDKVKSMLDGFNSKLEELKTLVNEMKTSKQVDDTSGDEKSFIDFDPNEFTTPSSQKEEDSIELEFDPEEIKQAVLDELKSNFVIEMLDEILPSDNK
jgi:HK97 family phage prohead protease